MNPVEKVVDCKCILGECPIWNVRSGELFWTEIESGELWRYNPAQNDAQIIGKFDFRIGGFAFTPDNAMILCTDKGIYKLNRNFTTLDLLYDIPFHANERFNDITTDPEGRIYAGTVSHGYTHARLFRLHHDKKPEVILHGLKCSNGMTFSMDETYFYHIDSHDYQITRYSYGRATGDITDPQVIYSGRPENGYPDGMTIDVQGNLWVAFWGASWIGKLSPDGKILERIRLKIKQPTSVTFGGKDMSELFITSAGKGLKGQEDGSLFRLKTETQGRPEWLAAF